MQTLIATVYDFLVSKQSMQCLLRTDRIKVSKQLRKLLAISTDEQQTLVILLYTQPWIQYIHLICIKLHNRYICKRSITYHK